ncbi:glycoside hydrolase family 3 N-terminal domain-containing protein [Streptomyces niveiscabiei]|uniref:glycoside hydrolase family 3 protein n=1 Tax=Streptomyces niveiscabiei TaxID=164115 RepID=UPI0029B0A5A8|nr:glycoside hydrolase family 3 N-terminal domain-containing protein [Streptomyces niveiscabiei]MDX3387173.1 glycoside hydrolase family 3 N-terminal domain-containing protein [Streptomyces niveiscabiei]
MGASFTAGPFSQWPDGLGLAALRDPDAVREFARRARDEYRAVGIRMAPHPQVDLAGEPRWARRLQTSGADTDLVVAYTRAYLEGFQGTTLDSTSVACVTKHFPGAGAQLDGEDAHFPYGREQVYPGGAFDEHLRPFVAAIEHDTAAIMPSYGMPVGPEIDGVPIEEVGFGYNRQILTGLLRERLGYDGLIITDWELVNDNLVAESRIDESARRVLPVKFRLGLFDAPFVDEDAAETRRIALEAQSRSVTVLKNSVVHGAPPLPLDRNARVYAEGVDRDAFARAVTPAATPQEADLAIVRIDAPFESRGDLFLESYFHQGSLELPPGLVHRLRMIAQQAPLIVDVALDRPAILTPLVDALAGLTVTFGVSDDALLDALTGRIAPRGRLPVELPRSTCRRTPRIRCSLWDRGSTSDDRFRAGFRTEGTGHDRRTFPRRRVARPDDRAGEGRPTDVAHTDDALRRAAPPRAWPPGTPPG